MRTTSLNERLLADTRADLWWWGRAGNGSDWSVSSFRLKLKMRSDKWACWMKQCEMCSVWCWWGQRRSLWCWIRLQRRHSSQSVSLHASSGSGTNYFNCHFRFQLAVKTKLSSQTTNDALKPKLLASSLNLRECRHQDKMRCATRQKAANYDAFADRNKHSIDV